MIEEIALKFDADPSINNCERADEFDKAFLEISKMLKGRQPKYGYLFIEADEENGLTNDIFHMYIKSEISEEEKLILALRYGKIYRPQDVYPYPLMSERLWKPYDEFINSITIVGVSPGYV